MAATSIPFPSLPWTEGSATPLEQRKSRGTVTLLRFLPGFADPEWCVRGHAGLVLAGRLRLELEDGAIEIRAGEGFAVDAGTRHRAVNPGAQTCELFIVTGGP